MRRRSPGCSESTAVSAAESSAEASSRPSMSSPVMSGGPASTLQGVHDPHDRQEQRDHDEADEHGHDEQDHRLDDLEERGHRAVDLGLEGVGHAQEHGVELAGLLADV